MPTAFLILLIFCSLIQGCLGQTTAMTYDTTLTTSDQQYSCHLSSTTNDQKNFWYQPRKRNTRQTCFLGTPGQQSCTDFEVFSIIVLNNEGDADKNMISITNFIDGVTKDCSSQSELISYTPKSARNNNSCVSSSTKTPNAVDKLTVQQVLVTDLNQAVADLQDLLTVASSCATNGGSLTRDEGGVLYVFTDIPPCSKEMCTDSMHDTINSVVQTFVSNFFVVRFNFLGITQKDCIPTLFKNCKDLTQFCNVTMSGWNPSGDECDLDKEIPTMKTCYSSGSSGMSLGVLIVSVAVPSICIMVICIVCAALCYKKTRNNQKLWRDFFMDKKRRAEANGENEDDYCPEAAKEAYKAARFTSGMPPMAKAFNHYMDIEALARANKKDEWEIEPKNLAVNDEQVLGNGAFACVYKGTLTGKIPLLKVHSSLNLSLENQNDTNCEVAVKRLPVHSDEESRLDFFHEIDFMKRLGYSAHIISMLGCVSNTFDPLIVVEYCHHGDLLRFLRTHRDDFYDGDKASIPEDSKGSRKGIRVKDLVSLAWQICDGLEYLASMKFIHRDIAARNVLLTKNMTAKISDFGLCRYVDSALYTAKGGRLPIKWMALESLKFYEYTTKSDIWAYGVLLFELFSLGDGPYQAVQPLDMVHYLESGERLPQPQRCPNEIYLIMQRCWLADKEQRPDASLIRSELTLMLNLDDENYGYLALPSAKNMPVASAPREDTNVSSTCKHPTVTIVIEDTDAKNNTEADD